jgi:hypothetical protein
MFWDVSKRKNGTGNQEQVHYFIWQLSVPFPIACIMKYSRTPLIRTLVIRVTNYSDRLGHAGKFVENSTKLTCLEITGYWINVMASRTSNRPWLKGLDAGTYC